MRYRAILSELGNVTSRLMCMSELAHSGRSPWHSLGDLFRFVFLRQAIERAPARICVELRKGRDAALVTVVSLIKTTGEVQFCCLYGHVRERADC